MECVFICMIYFRTGTQATNNGTVTNSNKYHFELTTNPCSSAMALANTSIMAIDFPAETGRCFRYMTKVYRLIIGIINYRSMLFPSPKQSGLGKPVEVFISREVIQARTKRNKLGE